MVGVHRKGVAIGSVELGSIGGGGFPSVQAARRSGVSIAAAALSFSLIGAGIASPIAMPSAYAQEQEDHVTLENFGTHDVGELPNTVQLTYDDSAKTFNITGSGKLDKSKFGYITYQPGRSWSDSDGVYGKYIMPLIQEAPENYTISFSREVKLPNDSNSLFSLKGTRVEFPEQFDTSNVTNMRNMFSNAVAANPNVSNWNTSNVTDMGYMFSGASNANPDVSNWDTSSVTDMTNMFTNAVAANPNVSNWNTSNVTDMSNMFSGALNANPNTSKWNTGKVTDMVNMFKNARVANPDVSNWDTSSVTDMGNMFYRAENADPDVSNWKTSNVTNMERMFYQASNVTPKVSNWDTGSVTNMEGMFAHTVKADPDVSNWDTSKVTVMRVMFTGATGANPDVSNWDTSNVVDMAGMFERASNAVPNVSKWDTRNVTDMNIMFHSATKADPDVSGWDTSKVTDMRGMFEGTSSANPDVSRWNVSNVTDFARLFAGSGASSIDVTNWNVDNASTQGAVENQILGDLDPGAFKYIRFVKGEGLDGKYPLPQNLSFRNLDSENTWFEFVDADGKRLEGDRGAPFKFGDFVAKHAQLAEGSIYSLQPATVAPTPSISGDTEAPTVNSVHPGDNIITGTGKPGATITVTGPNGFFTTTTVHENGNWSVDLTGGATPEAQYIVSQKDGDKNESDQVLVKVGKENVILPTPGAPGSSELPGSSLGSSNFNIPKHLQCAIFAGGVTAIPLILLSPLHNMYEMMINPHLNGLREQFHRELHALDQQVRRGLGVEGHPALQLMDHINGRVNEFNQQLGQFAHDNRHIGLAAAAIAVAGLSFQHCMNTQAAPASSASLVGSSSSSQEQAPARNEAKEDYAGGIVGWFRGLFNRN